jgi:hypothetical protein
MKTIIFASRHRWPSGDNRTQEAIAKSIGKKSFFDQVIYIPEPCSPLSPLKSLLSVRKEEATKEKEVYIENLLSVVYPRFNRHDDVCIYNPARIIPKSFCNTSLDKIIIKRQYKKVKKKLEENNTYLFLDPLRSDSAVVEKSINYENLIVHLQDDPFDNADVLSCVSSYPGIEQYKRLVKKADYVFANSENQIRKYNDLTDRKIHLIRSAARYTKKYHNPTVPKDIQNISRPRAGYVGSLNNSIKTGIIYNLARAYKDINFVFIGNITEEGGKRILEMSKKYENIHLLGHKINLKIPRYISSMDILFSMKDPNICKGNDSIKMYEYLLTGLPIVTTPVSPAHKFSDVMCISNNSKEFVNLFGDLLENDAEKEKQKRVRYGKKNTWSHRAEKIISIISNNQ